MVDKSEAKWTHDQLRLTQYGIDHAGDFIFWLSSDAHFRGVNRAFCQFLGYPRAELLKLTLQAIDPDFSARGWSDYWAEVQRHKSLTFESRYRARNGSVAPVEISASHIVFEDREYVFQFARDIRQRKQAEISQRTAQTELEQRIQERTALLSRANQVLQAEAEQRQRAEEAHREVLGRLVEAQELERSRIARELHDQLGQDLTALKLGLTLCKKQAAPARGAIDELAQLEQLADRLMQDIHRLAWQLRPTALDDFGLETALRRCGQEWSARSGVALDFHSQGIDTQRLPARIETTLYRVAQEALVNIHRHAQARRVSLIVERRPDHVLLLVEDDGNGFDVDAVLQSPGSLGKLGLLGMQERVALAHGSITVESTPKAGTTVIVRVPLHPASAPKEFP